MTDEELFLKEGACYMGQRLIYRQKDVGVNLTGTSFVLLPDGEEAIERLKGITDVEVKPARRIKKIEDIATESSDILS